MTWYSSADNAQAAQLAPTSALVNGDFPTDAVSFSAVGAANIATSGGFNRHATITGLKENTTYSYRVGADGNWSRTYSFKTQDFEGDYDFLFFGDPQIGASGNLAKDQPAGRTRSTSRSVPTRTPRSWSPVVTRSRRPTPRLSGMRSCSGQATPVPVGGDDR